MCIDLSGALAVIAITNTITPIPPIQWENDRQNSIDFGRISTFGTIEAPVVVRPLTISNKASVKEGISPLMTNGSAPTSELATQQTATAINPSFEKKIIFLGLRKKTIAAPTIKAPAMVSPNTKTQFHSPKIIAVIRGNDKSTPIVIITFTAVEKIIL